MLAFHTKEQKLSIETNLENIFNKHVATIEHGFKSIDKKQILKVAEMLALASTTQYYPNVFTIGNGASAAIAQHWACDYTKGCAKNNVKPRVISLAANIPLLTAIGNDISFDDIYSFQLGQLGRPDDILIAISSSGNSPNVVKALEKAKELKMRTVALTGFTGGKARELADIPIHVDIHEYEAAEDVHQAIMHMIAKCIRSKNDG